MTHDRVPHRPVALIVGNVIPRARLPGLCRAWRQHTPDGEDVGRRADVGRGDGRRTLGGNGEAIRLQAGHCAYGQGVLRIDAAERCACGETTLGRQLVEVGRGG